MTVAKRKKLKLVKLPTYKTEVDADVVELMEILLKRAKEGKMEGFAYVCVWPTGEYTTSFSKTIDVRSMLGAVEMLKFRMLSKWSD